MKEMARKIPAIIDITLYCAEIPILFCFNIIARTPIIKKRFTIPFNARLIQDAIVKTGGRANILEAPCCPPNWPIVNSWKVNLIVFINDIIGELEVNVYHEKVIPKRSRTVTTLSVSSNLGFILEIMKIRAT